MESLETPSETTTFVLRRYGDPYCAIDQGISCVGNLLQSDHIDGTVLSRCSVTLFLKLGYNALNVLVSLFASELPDISSHKHPCKDFQQPLISVTI